MLVCLWIFQTAFLELSYTAIKLNQVKSSASAIATSIKYGNDTTSTINQLSKENEMSVYVYNSTETILIQQYSSDYNNPTGHSDMEMHTVYNYYREAKDNGGRYITTTSALGDSQKQFVAVYGRDATDDEASGV
jgi:hypothetical protein